MRSRSAGTRVILTLDDGTGRIEAMLFEDIYQKYRDLIAKDALVLVDGTLRFDDFSDAWRLSAKRIIDLARWASRRRAASLSHGAGSAHTALLRRAWRHPRRLPARSLRHHGRVLRYCRARRPQAGPEWAVRAASELRERLEELLGHGAVDASTRRCRGSSPPLFADGR